MQIQSIRGINDILPDETATWNAVEQTAREIFETYGFQEIRTPILEKTNLFARSLGENTDIVEKEMYSFTDKGHEKVTLRPEGTASVVRAYIQHHLYQPPGLVKVYYLGPMFRYERPQAGRYRQFYQIGVEAFGVEDPALDAEILAMSMAFFRRLGLEEVSLQLNSLGCQACRPAFKTALQEHLHSRLPFLCEDCQRRFSQNPLRILDCKREECRQQLSQLPEMGEILCAGCCEHFEQVQSFLGSLQVPFQVNPRLVRGLDYYTRTAFEFTSDRLGAQNAVGGGGRYDRLVEEIGGPSTPSIGFALGMERMVALLEERGKKMEAATPQAFIAALGSGAERLAFELLDRLRSAGIRAERDYGNASLKSQMRKANRFQARYVVILGEEELASGRATVKAMQTGEQVPVPLEELVPWLQGK
ncbi:MAG: histidine--tRNA ligase [Candidatus Tectomicrobia bacterium]|uniref:Histidine--tRNA ligase n=1 Tax=Tectimicrobiota bacterium TaxID=2528274 RepID=A0A932FYV0_UNCTE|nr:histidine--tRNA ligase [Candidatus Tectomicrobia bacterium]